MAQNKDFDNTNRGTLFRNYDKEEMKNQKDTSKWANAQGTLNVYGMEFWISAWTKTIGKGDHKGDVMQQIVVKPKNEEEGEKLSDAIQQIINGGNPAARNNLKNKKSGKSSTEIPEEFDDMDDDLPF